ncbi:MAG: hypothetical protein H7Z37_05300 [Pyrinomonadaceae bacterium]|nr:hypothetical protein [Pyrinomonadaceae bacterium]
MIFLTFSNIITYFGLLISEPLMLLLFGAAMILLTFAARRLSHISRRTVESDIHQSLIERRTTVN